MSPIVPAALAHPLSQRRACHPDKVASLGPELRELAEAKSKEISVAYQEALNERGAKD